MSEFRFFLITDTHYFAEKLGCRGEAYKEFMKYEQKCFAETQKINEAAFRFLNGTDLADTVLIAGDLSFNGEKESHMGFIELLKDLKAHGKRVFVITAGHDFNDHPFAFDETGRLEPEGTKREELFDLYYEFGFSDAIAVDRENLSYVAQLAPGLRLLALNNDGDCKKNHTYTARQIEWILKQTKKAREDGETMIAMSHYPLLPGVPLFGLLGGEVVMKNADYITTLLADEGVHLCFTGHMHNQAVNKKVTEKGNLFYDVCTGSLIGCPASMRLVTITDNYRVQLETLPVPDFDWDLEGLTKDEYFKRQFDMMIDTYLTSMRDDPARFLGKLGMKEAPEGVRNVVEKVGGYLNGVTVGRLCKTLCVKCPEEIRDTLFVDLARELVRNCFTGNAPYVYGTPEYAAIMGVIGRFAKFIKINVNGKSVEFLPLVEKTIGKYGLDDDNTSFTLR
ncbi:MAG: metallophosphoesterase [Clostridia bacterium]|nr:metallophosphoesterase [Clostridia bacterium]